MHGLDEPAFLWPCRHAILTTNWWRLVGVQILNRPCRPPQNRSHHPSYQHPCAGKYLNAIRECGAPVPPSPLPGGRLRYDPGGAYLDAIGRALDAASGALLRLMLGQGQLMGWLRSIKHFFLLDQVQGGKEDGRYA